jgi:hypothetical protein
VIEWWPFVALLLLIGIALILGIGWLRKAALNETKHSPRFPAIKRAVDDGLKQEQDKEADKWNGS